MRTLKLITSLILISIFFNPIVASAEGTLIQDSAITTQIKAKLLAADNIDSMQIKVETGNNGVVMLTGSVKSEAEKEMVHKIAHAVNGVTNVVNELVINPNLK